MCPHWMRVAEEAQGDPVAALHLRAERGAGRDRQARAHDAGLAEAANAEIRQVHRAAHARVDAGRLAHQLREQPVHPRALADRVPVRAVVAHHVVLVAQRKARADNRRLLADRGMQRTGYLADLQLLDRRQFERPAPEHPAVHLARRLFGNVHEKPSCPRLTARMPGAGRRRDRGRIAGPGATRVPASQSRGCRAGRHVVTIVCGSNVDPDAYHRWVGTAPIHRS